MIIQQSPVGNTAHEVQSTPDFSLRLHFLITTLIYTGVSHSEVNRRHIMLRGGLQKFLYMNLYPQIKLLY